MPATDQSLNSISRDRMQEICRAIQSQLPDHCGFMLVVVPFGDGSLPAAPNADYAGNIQREDAIKSLKALLFRWGCDEKWMENTK